MRILEKRLSDETVHGLAQNQWSPGPTYVSDRAEADWTPQAVKPFEAHLRQHLDRPDVQEGYSPHRGIQVKAVVDAGEHDYMLKPYHDRQPNNVVAPISGWAEMTNQALYHAAGLGDHHQQVHVARVVHRGEFGDAPPREEPMLAIRLAPGHREAGHATFAPTPEHDATVRRIAVMDWLTHNHDRHSENLMADDRGRPLAIDHGASFQYGQLGRRASYAMPLGHADSLGFVAHRVGPAWNDPAHPDQEPILNWWRESSPGLRSTFQARLGLVRHPALREHLRVNFEGRADALDRAAAAGSPDAFWETAVPAVRTPGVPVPFHEGGF